jgi:hypothetical protein
LQPSVKSNSLARSAENLRLLSALFFSSERVGEQPVRDTEVGLAEATKGITQIEQFSSGCEFEHAHGTSDDQPAICGEPPGLFVVG